MLAGLVILLAIIWGAVAKPCPSITDEEDDDHYGHDQ